MLPTTHVLILLRPSSDVLPDHVLMLHAEPFETKLLSAELCILFIYFLKGNCIGLKYHIILSKIHIIVIIKTKIIDQNKSCSNILVCMCWSDSTTTLNPGPSGAGGDFKW